MSSLIPLGKYPGESHRRNSMLQRAILLCSSLICVALLLWSVYSSKRNALNRGCAACVSNFKWISTELLRYHERFGHFPPAYIADKNGKPMHSWRVVLLEIHNQELFNLYNFEEAWDGPNNRKLANLMPSFYACPNDHNFRVSPSSETNYVLLTGKGTAFPGNQSMKIENIADGLDKTVFLVETKNSGISWMEPRDMELSNLKFPANPSQRPALSSNDPGGPGMAFGDGSLQRMDYSITFNQTDFKQIHKIKK